MKIQPSRQAVNVRVRARMSNDHATSSPCRSVWPAVLVGKLPFAVGSESSLQIINRIAPFVAGAAVADLEIHDRGAGSIHQLMRDALRWKSGAHSRGELQLPRVRDQRRLALQDVDELILPAMAVKQGRFPAGMEGGQIDTKIPEPEHIAQRPLF